MSCLALVLAAAALLAGCGTDGRLTEAKVYDSLAGLEEARLFTVQAGAAAGFPEARAALEPQRRRTERARLLAQEAGGTPPLPFERTSDVDDVLPGLADVRSRADYLRFTAELDAVAEAAWRHARRAVR